MTSRNEPKARRRFREMHRSKPIYEELKAHEKNDEKEWRAATGTAITHRLSRPPEIAMLVVSENCVDALYHSDSMPVITVFCSPHPRRIGNESRDEKFKINTRTTIENVSSGSSHGGLGDGCILETHP